MKILLLSLLVSLTLAHDDGAESTSVGKGKGVEYYDEHEGFTLAEVAIKRLGVVTADPGSSKDCNLKSAQVVASLDKKFIYVLRSSKFKALAVSCEKIVVGDRVVTKGAEYLRVIEMDLGGGEEEEGADEHSDEHNDEQNGEKDHQDGDHHD